MDGPRLLARPAPRRKQVVLARMVTRDNFPLAHCTLEGHTQDLAAVYQVVRAVEKRHAQLRLDGQAGLC